MKSQVLGVPIIATNSAGLLDQHTPCTIEVTDPHHVEGFNGVSSFKYVSVVPVDSNGTPNAFRTRQVRQYPTSVGRVATRIATWATVNVTALRT